MPLTFGLCLNVSHPSGWLSFFCGSIACCRDFFASLSPVNCCFRAKMWILHHASTDAGHHADKKTRVLSTMMPHTVSSIPARECLENLKISGKTESYNV